MKIKYLIFLCFFTVLLISCDVSCGSMNNNQSSDSIEMVSNTSKPMMMNTFENDFTKLQFDSICRVEKISNKLSDWHMFMSRDAETKEVFQEYMYIKSVGKNEAIYRLLIKENNIYRLTKRIIKE